MAHPNEDLLRQGYQAFAEGDMQTLDELFDDEIAWHVPGNNPLSGEYNGKQEVFGFFGKINELADSFSIEVHDVLANEEHGVALTWAKGERAGKTLESQVVQVFHINEDGRVTESWGHSHDQAAEDNFWT